MESQRMAPQNGIKKNKVLESVMNSSSPGTNRMVFGFTVDSCTFAHVLGPHFQSKSNWDNCVNDLLSAPKKMAPKKMAPENHTQKNSSSKSIINPTPQRGQFQETCLWELWIACMCDLMES